MISPEALARAWVPNRGAACTTAAILSGLGVLGASGLPGVEEASRAPGAWRGAGRESGLGPGGARPLRHLGLAAAPAGDLLHRRPQRAAGRCGGPRLGGP